MVTKSLHLLPHTAVKEHVSVGRPVAIGALAGLGGSIVMAGYAMIASATYQSHGFSIPLYHIASVFISSNDLMMSMKAAMGGSTYKFFLGGAILGAVINTMVGLMYGAMFGALVSMMRRRGPVLVGAGVVWGASVFVINSWIGLPVTAAIFSSGDQITHMAKMVGYGSFLLEHMLFGLVVAVVGRPVPAAGQPT